ncbi:MAG: STAS domain-containing protein [Chitinivibrionales bacterium]|nr:STAS domain-containing protein [Chitinivibrionales bacterium]
MAHSEKAQDEIKGLTIERKSATAWITLPDAISMDDYRQVEKKIDGCLDEKVEKVVVDLCNTTHMYSSGFGMIVRLKKNVSGRGGDLCLVNVSDKIQDGFESVGLQKIVAMYKSADDLDR